MGYIFFYLIFWNRNCSVTAIDNRYKLMCAVYNETTIARRSFAVLVRLHLNQYRPVLFHRAVYRSWWPRFDFRRRHVPWRRHKASNQRVARSPKGVEVSVDVVRLAIHGRSSPVNDGVCRKIWREIGETGTTNVWCSSVNAPRKSDLTGGNEHWWRG